MCSLIKSDCSYFDRTKNDAVVLSAMAVTDFIFSLFSFHCCLPREMKLEMLSFYSFQANSVAARAPFQLTETSCRHVARSLKLISCFSWSRQHPELYRFSLLRSYLSRGSLPFLMPCDKERAAAVKAAILQCAAFTEPQKDSQRARQTTCEQTGPD